MCYMCACISDFELALPPSKLELPSSPMKCRPPGKNLSRQTTSKGREVAHETQGTRLTAGGLPSCGMPWRGWHNKSHLRSNEHQPTLLCTSQVWSVHVALDILVCIYHIPPARTCANTFDSRVVGVCSAGTTCSDASPAPTLLSGMFLQNSVAPGSRDVFTQSTFALRLPSVMG